MSIETEPTGELIANEAPGSAKKKTAAAKPKGAPASKTRKAAGRPPQSSRAKPKGEKLICRYCGSDDLAPSFRTRRDARCRACFKQRYGSAARNQKASPSAMDLPLHATFGQLAEWRRGLTRTAARKGTLLASAFVAGIGSHMRTVTNIGKPHRIFTC